MLSKIKKIGVVGAGTMGSGIAQLFSQQGYSVVMLDMKEEFVLNGLSKIKNFLEEGVKKGKVKHEEMSKTLANIKGTVDYNELKDCDLIIEAVFEEMEVKKEVFEKLESVCKKECIFTSNTSTLSITELAKFTKRENNFAGLHFFNPAQINRLVEVIPGEKTPFELTIALTELSRINGKFPIIVKDSPGFAVNRFFVPFLNEACRIYEEGKANIPTIDFAGKSAFSIGMGAFELMNFTGIPIAYHSQTTLSKLGKFYAVSPLLKRQYEKNEKWDLSGEIQNDKINEIKERFLALTFAIVSQLLDEGICTKEDVDKGATTGLRWQLGPFALMNKYGIEKSYELVKKLEEHYKGKLKMPKSLLQQFNHKKEWYLSNVKTIKQGRIATVLMDKPESLNALSTKVLSDLECSLYEIKNDKNIDVVIITGEGNSFVAGADIKEMSDKSSIEAKEFTSLGQRVFRQIEELDKVVICAVNGFALGGGSELAISCDIIIASEKAKFGLPEVTLGIHPGFGGTQRLPRLIGKARAKELIFTGDIIDSKTAKEIGLCNKVVKKEELMEECMNLANKILSRGQIAVKFAKNCINRGMDMDLGNGLAYEVESVSILFSTDDLKEGMKAFIEKRKAEFKGK